MNKLVSFLQAHGYSAAAPGNHSEAELGGFSGSQSTAAMEARDIHRMLIKYGVEAPNVEVTYSTANDTTVIRVSGSMP